MRTASELRQIRPDDPFVRWRLEPTAEIEALSIDDNLVWTRQTKRGERWAYLFGSNDTQLIAMLEDVTGAQPVDGITCPEHLRAHLPERFLGPDAGHWSLWIMDAPTELRSGNAKELDLLDPRIEPLLRHSASAYVFPGDPRMVRWIGVEKDGALLAVAGHQRDMDDAAHIVSVCTAPDHRGTGLAREVLSLLVAKALADDVPAILLEMYVDNPPAAALYRSLGFTEVGRFYSWLIGIGGEPPLA